MKKVGLYIHIPFCIQKCHYCDFTSYILNNESVKVYLNNLKQEIDIYGKKLKNYKIVSVFIGGGTPSILSTEQISLILNSVYKKFNVDKNIEITLESNPGTLSKEKLASIFSLGINRLSMGLQSTHNETLEKIGRMHTFEKFLIQYNNARDAGFENINLDLIYSLPGEKIEKWQQTLTKVAELNPEHISAYSLKIEEGTKFYDLDRKNKLLLPNEEEDRSMYHFTIEFLEKHGYNQYEISNFAKTNYECLHNKIYWNNYEYIGLGVSSHSYLNSRRFSNTKDLREYSKSLSAGELPVVYEEIKTEKDKIFETMFLGLRQNEGIDIERFKKRFDINPMDLYKEKIEKLIKLNLLEVTDSSIKLTKYGIDVSNQVFLEFIID